MTDFIAYELESRYIHIFTNLREKCAKGDVARASSLLESLGNEASIIINATPNSGNTLLFSACEEGREEVVRLLVDYGADGRIHPVTKYSPLYIACYSGRTAIVDYLLTKFPELVNVETVEKWLPIHGAVIHNHVHIVSKLLNYDYPSYALVKFIDQKHQVEYKFAFDVNSQDVTGKTPLYIASLIRNQNLVELLLKFSVVGRKLTKKKDIDYNPANLDSDRKIGLNQSLTSPGKQISPSISSIITKLSSANFSSPTKNLDENEIKVSVVDPDLYCNNGTETALHTAIRRKQYSIASLLLQHGADPNLPILNLDDSGDGPDTVKSGTTSLAVACNTRESSLVDLLIRFGARDDQSSALHIASKNGDNHLISRLLALKSFPDPEYKIYKKTMEFSGFSNREMATSVTVSSIFPTTPVMVNWYSLKCLQRIEKEWLISASIAHNIKFKLDSQKQSVVLNAITRLDLSNNNLTSVPFCVFQLPSLRILNLSHNRLTTLPEIEEEKLNTPTSSSQELYLQNNRIDLLPHCVFELPSLHLLDLSNNKLTSLPNRLWSAPKLRDLNLSYNLLRELPLKLPSSVSSSSVESPHLNSSKLSHKDFFGDETCSLKSIEVLNQRSIKHVNLWNDDVHIVTDTLPEESAEVIKQCKLNNLNLSHNSFFEIPENLACLAVNLSRLNLSYNNLGSMGNAKSYPVSLKHLDLSHNRIHVWPSMGYNDQEEQSKHYICYGIDCSFEQSSSKPSKLKRIKFCIHKQHNRFTSLKTLILAHNKLVNLIVANDDQIALEEFEPLLEADGKAHRSQISRTLFPSLSMLDVSCNFITEIPPNISELTHLSVLNIAHNPEITRLPPQMGLLSKLWNLSTTGCNLNEPLKSMISGKKYKTMDIIGYLKSILENSKPYARMKLMIVGIQGIGKTSLLEQLRQEGTGSYRRKPPEHWSKRIGNKNINLKTPRGVTLSTVGVDVCDWTFEKKIKGQQSFGPVTFRTWDFGGQREYYATHQYFLSKRSLYLVLWKMIDGEKAVEGIQQWLVNIQARAPNSPVIIVGTHYDLISDYFPRLYSEDLQQMIRDKFMNVIDPDKCGLPRVIDSIEISIKTRHNIKTLCHLIYDTVFDLRCPGSKERLLEQKIPATYLALEDVVGYLAAERRFSGKDPVLRSEQYKTQISTEMRKRFNLTFRDDAELHQATTFLHENGVLLHYNDATLKDLYFLDPQWLCDQLAHIVTIREINPYARNGIMKTDDLKHLFKSSELSRNDIKYYIINLLNKFEIALTWDSRTLMIPSLLPTEEAMLSGVPSCDVRIPVRSRGWGLRGGRYTPVSELESKNLSKLGESAKESTAAISRINRPDKSIYRLLLMTYFPSGFWSRLMTRVLADDAVIEIVRSFYKVPYDFDSDSLLLNFLNRKSEWICWQTGFALKHLDHEVFHVKEVILSLDNINYDHYQKFAYHIKQEGLWMDVEITKSSILEIHLPNHAMNVKTYSCGEFHDYLIEPNQEYIAKLLALTVDHIDTLLEDWYPSLGTRFVHTSEGKFLVTRMIPCTQCFLEISADESTTVASNCSRDMVMTLESSGSSVEIKDWWSSSLSSSAKTSNIGSVKSVNSLDSGVDNCSSVSSANVSTDNCHINNNSGKKLFNDNRQTNQDSIQGNSNRNRVTVVYSFMVEECILQASQEKTIVCPLHGSLDLKVIAPDIMFLDLAEHYLIKPETIRRGKMLGRGAFGFVFRASVHSVAFKAASSKWDRDPLQYACKAYCIARQELNILLTLRHPNIVPLVGVCPHPLALVLRLAPQGALDLIIKDYRRSGVQLNSFVIQKIILQIAKALEYLHQQRIIYRDLKSENVLVWEIPRPYCLPSNFCGEVKVDVKLADYGISRAILPTGAKGFAGTEGFMAPEIMKYNGEEEYTEKVDCFSFGMFIYELLSLRQPFEGQDCVKDHILEGNRPILTERDTFYPCYFLDLMVLCWSQAPDNRPSASQIVSIASAPEFVHLLDVVLLQDNFAPISSILIPNKQAKCFELYIGRHGKQTDLLIGNNHLWQDYRSVNGLLGYTITSMCNVQNYLWLGDGSSCVHIFNIDTYQEITNFTLESTCIEVVVTSIRSMVYLEPCGSVAVLNNSGQLWIVDVASLTVREISSESMNPYLCITGLQKSDSAELWCGQAEGLLSIMSFTSPNEETVDLLNHYSGDKLDFPEKLDVLQITSNNSYAWTYLYPGCLIYQWDVSSRSLLHKLDCSKLLPCSESIRSIGIEEQVYPENCQITSMTIAGNELIVGTTWGCLIVLEASTMRPITVFRPYEDEIRNIIYINGSEVFDLFDSGYYNEQKNQESTSQSSLSQSKNPQHDPQHDDEYILTIGKGYRNLANRFLHDCRDGEIQYHTNGYYCIIWKSGNWVLS
uniref:non-specific serine/threonine protein kinase n=1 Tax=Tetranychus urticae TaxID=32264 RepID=T1K991_TETUR